MKDILQCILGVVYTGGGKTGRHWCRISRSAALLDIKSTLLDIEGLSGADAV